MLKIGKHAWKSLSWWTVGPAVGWQINVKFGCRHVLWFSGAGVNRSGHDPNFVYQNCQLVSWSGAGLATDAAGAVTAWHGITLMDGAQSKLHCSEIAAVTWWCWSVHHEAQRCSSLSWTGSDYMLLTSALTQSIEAVWCDGWPANDSCTTEQPCRHVCGMSGADWGGPSLCFMLTATASTP